MTTIAVFTTIDNLEHAQAMARALVERKLAACVQISTIESIYQWQAAMQNDREFRLLYRLRRHVAEGRHERAEHGE